MSYGNNELVRVYPSDTDPAVTAFVQKELRQLLSVAEHPNLAMSVTLQQPQIRNTLAMAYPNGDITIRPSAVDDAMKSQAALWSLRMVIAHELGHVMGGHWFTRGSGRLQKELEADQLGMQYFRSLGWPCTVWVDGFRSTTDQGIGTTEHDAKARYEQARQLCEGEK
jgi:predicted Zn-dependent protease